MGSTYRRLIFGLAGIGTLVLIIVIVRTFSSNGDALSSGTGSVQVASADQRDTERLNSSDPSSNSNTDTQSAADDSANLVGASTADSKASRDSRDSKETNGFMIPPLEPALKAKMLECVSGVKTYANVGADEFSSFDEFLDLGLAKNGERVRDENSSHTDTKSRKGSNRSDSSSVEIATQVVNVHVRDEMSGEIFRLHVAPQNLNQPAGETRQFDLKYFGVDRENLPIPMPVPDDLMPNLSDFRWQESIEKFKRRGDVVYDEVVETWSWKDPKPKSARVTKDFGKIREFQMFFEGRSIGCSGSTKNPPNCRCF